MVSEAGTVDAPITQDEINAVRDQLLQTVNMDELKGKNSAVLTVMMPLPLRVMIDEAAEQQVRADHPDWSDEQVKSSASAADYARVLFARELDYTLPTKSETKSKRNKRDVEVQQKAQRAMVAELIERARKGEISL